MIDPEVGLGIGLLGVRHHLLGALKRASILCRAVRDSTYSKLNLSASFTIRVMVAMALIHARHWKSLGQICHQSFPGSQRLHKNSLGSASHIIHLQVE